MNDKQLHDVAKFIADICYPYRTHYGPENWRVKEAGLNWGDRRFFELSELVPIIQQFWPSATLDKVAEVLGWFPYILRTRPGFYEIRRSDLENWHLRVRAYNPPQAIHGARKSGVCPKCGDKVKNKNRHNNPDHDGHSCRLSRVKKIMDM